MPGNEKICVDPALAVAIGAAICQHVTVSFLADKGGAGQIYTLGADVVISLSTLSQKIAEWVIKELPSAFWRDVATLQSIRNGEDYPWAQIISASFSEAEIQRLLVVFKVFKPGSV